MKRLISCALAALLVLGGMVATGQAAPRVLRLSTDHTRDFVTTIALREFADQVNRESQNRLKIEVYDGGQLGDEKACLEQIQFGALDFTKNSLAPLTEFIPTLNMLNMLNMPYLFRDVNHMWKVLGGKIGNDLLGGFGPMQMEGLGWIDAGSRCFYSTKTLNGPEDIKGLKIRVQESQIMMGMVEALGGLPVPMPASDVYSALQTGVAQAAENNIPRFLDMSHQEVAKHLIVDRHNILPEVFLASKQTMDSLSPEDQAIVRKAAKDLQAKMITRWAETENKVLAQLKDMGITVVMPDAATVARFRKACQPVYDKHGKDYAAMIEQINAVR